MAAAHVEAAQRGAAEQRVILLSAVRALAFRLLSSCGAPDDSRHALHELCAGLEHTWHGGALERVLSIAKAAADAADAYVT